MCCRLAVSLLLKAALRGSIATWHLGPLLRVNPLGTSNRNIRESQSKVQAKSQGDKRGPPVRGMGFRRLRSQGFLL